jgi:hypothetical protein
MRHMLSTPSMQATSLGPLFFTYLVLFLWTWNFEYTFFYTLRYTTSLPPALLLAAVVAAAGLVVTAVEIGG